MYSDEVVRYSFYLKDEKNIATAAKRKENKELTLQLIKDTSFLPEKSKLSQRVWFVCNNTNIIPTCIICGGTVSWRKQIKEYAKYCSPKCSNNDPHVKSKVKQTKLQKYGNSNYNNTNKIKKTNIDRYGVENVFQNEQVQTKAKQTNLEKYGFEYATKSSVVQNKIQKTNLEKYNYKCSFQNENVKLKYRNNFFKKHGVFNPLQQTHVKDQIKRTNLEKYSRESHVQIHISDETLKLLDDKEWLLDQHQKQKKTLTEISDLLGVTVRTVCNRFEKFNISVLNFRMSYSQRQINDFVGQYTDTLSNTYDIISPQEVDVYLPEYRIAIEYDGIYWHSEYQGKNKQYHLNKTKACNEQGIRLIHIWETEWLYKQEIVKSRLLNLIGQSIRIYARKCYVVNVSTQTKTQFLNDNHIQGDCPSSIDLGLVYNGVLAALMTFGKSRFNKKYEYELIRYCNKLNTSVVGGASKLFKHFNDEYNPKTVISYSDKRWNTGKLYEHLGFKYLHTSQPNFFHFHINNPLKLYSRQQFQKHKLRNKLEKFDESLSAIENMNMNGYSRIWDCGNDVYAITLDN